MPFSPIPEAIARLAQGGMVIVTDDADRENEGDLVAPAETITPAQIAFMMRRAGGLICVPMVDDDLARLDLPQMVGRNTDTLRTAFTVSVDALRGTHTGISANDRATTIRALADPRAEAADFARPGHVFPLRAHPGGVLERPGHTEAAVDLARLAGRRPCGVICEICRDDGSMARLPDLEAFAAEHGLPLITIADLIDWRQAHLRPALQAAQ